MSETITIGNVTVGPGEVKRGSIEVGQDVRGRTRDIPIIVYRGIEEGPCLWLNGATHGDEPEGTLSIFQALRQLDATRLRNRLRDRLLGTFAGPKKRSLPTVKE